MPLLDRAGNTEVQISRVGDVGAGSNTINWHQTWWERTGNTDTMVYSAEQYLFQNGKNLIGMHDYNWGATIQDQPNGKDGILLENTSADFGATLIGNVLEGGNMHYVRGYCWASASKVDLRPYTKCTIYCPNWRRDGSSGGYYHTTIGFFSSRVVGRAGWAWDDPPPRPTSMLAGYLCNEFDYGQYGTLDISHIDSAYFGFSSCGAFYGHGAITVREVRLHN